MINTAIGHAEIRVRDKVYGLIPSLVNISKIGTAAEIVECFSFVCNPIRNSYKLVNGTLEVVNASFGDGFYWASKVLNCCGLPELITGWTVSRESDGGYPLTIPVEGKIGFNDVFVLAAHCLKHGVCGVVESDAKGDPLTEFDAYFYIHLAHKALGITLAEARNLTMTELSLLMEAERSISNGDKVKQVELKQQRSAFGWYSKKKAGVSDA